MSVNIKSEQSSKRTRILEVATEMFMCRGFSAVSMDAIAQAAPVSKPTLYNHFKDKEALFRAAIENRCARVHRELEQGLSGNRSVEDSLYAFGRQFVSLVFAPDAVNVHRISIGESNAFPELGKLFFESGPQKQLHFLKNFLMKLHEQELLYIPNPELSADMFLGMLKGYNQTRLMLHMQETVSDEKQEEIARHAVRIFIHGHALIK